MDRSRFILAKDCEAVKPGMRATCCNSLMFDINDYDQVNCEKYGFRSEWENYANTFQASMMDCIVFKREGKCCLAKFMQ
jgi:hypothetical protein